MNNGNTIGYLILNPLDNTQQYISSADLETLEEAQNQGMVLIREDSDGTRDFATPDEVYEWLTRDTSMSINIVQQEVFVPIMESLLELIESSMKPAVALLSVSGEKKTVNNKFDDFKSKVNDMLERYKPNIEDSETE